MKFDDKALAKIREKNYRSSLIIVDHLAFTVRLCEFAQLERAGDIKNYNFYRLPKKSYKRATDHNLRNQLVEDYQAELRHCCFMRLRQFMQKILGVQLSNARDKGLHGYSDSYRILTQDKSTELGFVGFGGNNDTVYIQLSGLGCRHVFANRSAFSLHFWLSEVLHVQRLSRVDLAYDCFDGNFDADYAIRAYEDAAFKNPNGGKYPQQTEIIGRDNGKVVGRTIAIGSRQSSVYWRIYDKAAEQGCKDKVWWRSEVELKKCSVDALQNPAITFAAINAFSNSFNLEADQKSYIAKRRVALDIEGKLKYIKRQCGKAMADIVDYFDGDLGLVFGLVSTEYGGKFGIPDTEALILKQLALEGYKNEIDKRYRLQ